MCRSHSRGTVQVPGRVVYVNPLHNLSVVAYDPALIGDTPVKSATLAPGGLREGSPVWVVGLSADGQPHTRATQIAGGRSAGAAAVALDALPRYQSGCCAAGESPRWTMTVCSRTKPVR